MLRVPQALAARAGFVKQADRKWLVQSGHYRSDRESRMGRTFDLHQRWVEFDCASPGLRDVALRGVWALVELGMGE